MLVDWILHVTRLSRRRFRPRSFSTLQDHSGSPAPRRRSRSSRQPQRDGRDQVIGLAAYAGGVIRPDHTAPLRTSPSKMATSSPDEGCDGGRALGGPGDDGGLISARRITVVRYESNHILLLCVATSERTYRPKGRSQGCLSFDRLRGAAIALAVAATALVAGLVAAPPANAASCAVTWGSGPKVAAGMTSRQLTGVRAGRHTCYDRLVIDLNGAGRTSCGVPRLLRQQRRRRRVGAGRLAERGRQARRGGSCTRLRRRTAGRPTRRPTVGTRQRHRLPDLPPTGLRRQLRGSDHDRARRAGPVADAGLPAGRPRHRAAAGDRRRPPVVRGVASGRGSACHERWTGRNQLKRPR